MAVELTPSASSALPYVSWSSSSIAVIPSADWPHVFGSMQALKGHVQEYPGCQKLEAFLERGYTFERMLADVAGIQAEPPRLMEKIF
jgi:hypothetical protein